MCVCVFVCMCVCVRVRVCVCVCVIDEICDLAWEKSHCLLSIQCSYSLSSRCPKVIKTPASIQTSYVGSRATSRYI